MKAWNPDVTREMRKQVAELQSLGWYHSIELPGGDVIPGLQTVGQLRTRLKQFPIPEDLSGKRVLDIGAWDGWFSFEMERRGASVVATDLVSNPKFLLARDMLNSKVEYRVSSVYDLRPEQLGHFDIVLFLGVLYHLKHPLLGLERVCALGRDLVCVESYVTDDGTESKPRLEFYETTELCGQFDNWCGPNVACLLAMCRAAGFARVALESVIDDRAHVTCFRTWPESRGGTPKPYIVCVANSVSGDHEFSGHADDYVSIWMKTPDSELSPDIVFPMIGNYAARPVFVGATGSDAWNVTVKVPPGTAKGWHDVRVRVRDSAYSNAVKIGVDVTDEERLHRSVATPAGAGMTIEGAADGLTWDPYRVRMRVDPCLSLWVRNFPGPRELEDVTVRLRGGDMPAVFVSEPDSAGLTQVNALLPNGLALGTAEVNIVVRGEVSLPVRIELIPDDPRGA